METQSRRRSDRVTLTLLLEASGTDSHGHVFSESTRTLMINKTGGMIVLGRELRTDQQFLVKRKAPTEAHRQSKVRVVGQFGQQKEGFLYSIEIVDGSNDLWASNFRSFRRRKKQ
jgi:hypothetical protein